MVIFHSYVTLPEGRCWRVCVHFGCENDAATIRGQCHRDTDVK
jgi:hypothetical protein